MTLREIEQAIGTGEVGRHCRSGWRGQAANLHGVVRQRRRLLSLFVFGRTRLRPHRSG
jgi:hypothetical protein